MSNSPSDTSKTLSKKAPDPDKAVPTQKSPAQKAFTARAKLSSEASKLAAFRAGLDAKRKEEGCTDPDSLAFKGSLKYSFNTYSTSSSAQTVDKAIDPTSSGPHIGWNAWSIAPHKVAAFRARCYGADAAKNWIEDTTRLLRNGQEEGEDIVVSQDGFSVEVRSLNGRLKFWVEEKMPWE